MLRKIIRPVMTVLLCVFMLAVYCGAAGADEFEEEPVDGDTTNLTDYNAPKKIESVKITEFDASFCLATRWKADEYDNFFHFVVKPDGQGVLMASEEILGISSQADDELLSKLQEVIEQNDLAEMNGIYVITAGLPPEYSEGGMKVHYASGETLSFITDNDPYALWAEEVYDVFARWFAEKGDISLYPPEEDSMVTSLRMELAEEGINLEYHVADVNKDQAVDGETHLLSIWVYDRETLEDLLKDYVVFPDDYYEKITEILEKYNFVRSYEFSYYNHDSGLLDMHDLGYYGFGDKTPESENDSEDKYFSLYVTYDNDRRFSVYTEKESEIEAMRPMIEELRDYHDSIFFPEPDQSEIFSLIINEPDDAGYSYIRCDFYLGDTQFGYFLGCPDEGDSFTHFDLAQDSFEGIEGDFDMSMFRAELSLGYNDYSGEDALIQAMMGNAGSTEPLASLQFTPEYGERYEYNIISDGDGYKLEEKQ